MQSLFIKLAMLAVVSNELYCFNLENFSNASEQSLELCVVNTALSDDRWIDSTQKFLAQSEKTYHVQRLVASSDPNFTVRVCSIIISPLSGNKESVQVIENLFYSKALNRFAWVVMVSVEDQSKNEVLLRYRKFVRKHNSLYSLLIIRSEIYRHDLTVDQNNLVSSKDLTVQFMRKKSLQMNGWPLRVENPKNSIFKRRNKQIIQGVYYMLLKEFTGYTNASIHWILPSNPAPKARWFIENRIDVILNAPLFSYTRFEIIPEYHLQGICLLAPEQIIGPYVYHLMKPFQTSLWILLLLITLTITGLNMKFKDWFQSAICFQILFGVSCKIYKFPCIERAVLLMLFWLMFILCECYSTEMITFMINTRYQPHLRSIEEYNKIGYKAIIQDDVNTRKFHFPSIDPQRLEYRDKIDRFSTNESYLTLCDWAQLFVGSDQNLDLVNKQRRFYVIPEIASKILTSYVFLSFSIFTVQFKLIYYKLIEAGIWDHWEQNERKDFKQQEQLQHLDLTFDDLISIWWLLAWGAILGGTALLLEIAAFQRSKITVLIIVLKEKIVKLKIRFKAVFGNVKDFCK